MGKESQGQNLLPTIFVIFGATGDLMRKKLAVSLFRLYKKGLLPKLFQVAGFAKEEITNEQFRERVQQMIEATAGASKAKVAQFARCFFYQHGFFEDLEGYRKMAETLGRHDTKWQVCSNKLFYIAASPQFYQTIFVNLDASGLTESCGPEGGWTRVVVEKPFGKNLATAKGLDRMLGKLFKEEQIYRVDHYLGKETVQNILAFRFSNSFLQDSWNAKGIESIHIKLLEKGGIGDRGEFYDGIGVLRDVGQNHMLQLLALFTMENPGSFADSAIREKRANILRSLRFHTSKDVIAMTVRAQYEGYTQEHHVQQDSKTETYFRIKTYLETPIWKGVPIELESGKAMSEDRVEVVIVFRHPTPCLCPPASRAGGPAERGHYRNSLHYQIQPNEGIEIRFWVKKPGSEMELVEKSFRFNYREAFNGDEITDAYEKLLLNAVKGDQTLFVSTEEIMASWKFIDRILRAWQHNVVPLASYKKNSTYIV